MMLRIYIRNSLFLLIFILFLNYKEIVNYKYILFRMEKVFFCIKDTSTLYYNLLGINIRSINDNNYHNIFLSFSYFLFLNFTKHCFYAIFTLIFTLISIIFSTFFFFNNLWCFYFNSYIIPAIRIIYCLLWFTF